MIDPIKIFTLQEVREKHKKEYPNLMLGYYMDEMAHKLLEDTPGLKKVQVIVSDTFKYEYRKSKLEIA